MTDRLYSLSEIDEIIKGQTGDLKYSIFDVILLLLYADKDPIRGRTRQMKEIFLALKELLPERDTQPIKFEKRQFGPYSDEAENIIDQMAFSNFVLIEGNRKKKDDYSLSIAPKGINYIKDKFNALPSEVQNLFKQKRLEWDTTTPTALVHYIYIHNEEYLKNSLLKNRYRKLDWTNDNQGPKK